MIYSTPQCMNCSNYDTLDNDNLTCKAFPKGIPENILTGEFDHTKKHPTQKNNILFEPTLGKSSQK